MSVAHSQATRRVVRLVAGLTKPDLLAGRDVGAFGVALSLLVDADRFELVCVVDGDIGGNNSQAGFHFCGALASAQRCLRQPVDSLAQFCALLRASIETSVAALLVIDEPERGKAFWHVVGAGGDTLGFVPLRRAAAFHNVAHQPVLLFESNVELHVCADVDRNALLPQHVRDYVFFSSVVSRSRWL